MTEKIDLGDFVLKYKGYLAPEFEGKPRIATTDDLDLVSIMNSEERKEALFEMNSFNPDDSKYKSSTVNLSKHLSFEAEWKMCAMVQYFLIETRKEFGKATQENVDEVKNAVKNFDALNASRIEKEVTKHDQLAVIEELGRYTSVETKALLHPGTTSYDILDTARSYLFKKAWSDVIRPEISKTIEKLCKLSEDSIGLLQVGRTHLQHTTPVPLESTFAGYAARLAGRVENIDSASENLKGKISGMVGTGAGVEMVMGEGTSAEFEEKVLEKLDLKPDTTATQIVQKDYLSDFGHGFVSLMQVIKDFANDVRMAYSSDIGEMTSRDNAERLGGSSADAMKNNPINYENIIGKAKIVESGMSMLYELQVSNFQRDLTSSVIARYQPQSMMVETYESMKRLNRALGQLSINEDKLDENMQGVAAYPAEAMTAILRGEKFVHSKHGEGHSFVKKIGVKAKKNGKILLEEAFNDKEFSELYDNKLTERQKNILLGDFVKYLGHSRQNAQKNREYAMNVAGGK